MSRYKVDVPKWYVIESMPSMGNEPDGILAGPFYSFDESEAYREKYFGPDNINYYTEKVSDDRI